MKRGDQSITRPAPYRFPLPPACLHLVDLGAMTIVVTPLTGDFARGQLDFAYLSWWPRTTRWREMGFRAGRVASAVERSCRQSMSLTLTVHILGWSHANESSVRNSPDPWPVGHRCVALSVSSTTDIRTVSVSGDPADANLPGACSVFWGRPQSTNAAKHGFYRVG